MEELETKILKDMELEGKIIGIFNALSIIILIAFLIICL